MVDGLMIQCPISADLESAYAVYELAITLAFEQEGIGEDAKQEIIYKKSLIHEFIESRESKFFFMVAKLHDQVIGTISFGPCGNDVKECTNHELDALGELGGLYVLPEYQGKGVGSALITSMLKHQYSMGIAQFCLDCGLKSAQEKWLRKFGAPYKVMKDYWGEGSDHLIWLCNVRDHIE